MALVHLLMIVNTLTLIANTTYFLVIRRWLRNLRQNQAR